MTKKKDLFYNIYILIIYIIIMFFIFIIFSKAEEVKIIKCVDGDTIKVLTDNLTVKTIRVLEVDTFESRNNEKAKKQAKLFNLEIEQVILIGQMAKQLCIEYWLNTFVIIDCWKKDKYKRELCYVYDMKKNKYSDYMIKKKVGYYVKEY